MKRKFHHLLLLVLLLAGTASAQSGPLGNEWIDYSKTYYRLVVTGTGVHRVNWSTLLSAGMSPQVTGSQLKLFRDGKEERMFVSAENLTGGDYIEFYGRPADGLLDAELYGGASNQLNTRRSLFTDTAIYFLVAGTTGAPLRYSNAANNIPGNPGAPLAWCWSKAGTNYKTAFSPGKTNFTGQRFYSSRFDEVEGFIHALKNVPEFPQEVLTVPLANLVSSAGVNASVKTAIITNSYTISHQFQLSLNNSLIASSNFGPSDVRHFNVAVPASQLTASVALKYAFTGWVANNYDQYGVPYTEITYPRSFAMDGGNNLSFSLSPSASAQYIEISNAGAANGRLFDITSGQFYVGSPSGGVIRFYISPSVSQRDFVFTGDGATLSPQQGGSILFTNYDITAKQGRYIIVSHRQLMQPHNGLNQVQEYANYRSSATGGGYTVAIADVEELYDQYAYGYRHHPLAIRHFLKAAYNGWPVKPEYTLILGRGVQYQQLQTFNNNAATYPFPDVPTYGYPGSDPALVNFNSINKLSMCIGRVSARSSQEIADYLKKIKDAEIAHSTPAFPTTASENWKRQVLHIAGTADASIQQTVLGNLNRGKAIIEGPFTGAMVNTVAKGTTGPISSIQSALVDTLLARGLSHITFHGHASTTGFDYNLNYPETYNTAPRLPLLLALGCEVGQMFSLSTVKSLAERFVFAPSGGSIVTIAQDAIGFTNYHDQYLSTFYTSEAKTNYGGTLGRHHQYTFDSLMNTGDTVFTLTQLESMHLFGDPAMRLGNPSKPDYYVGKEGIAAIPSNVSAALDSFAIRVYAFNLGKATTDSVKVRVTHTNPLGVDSVVYNYTIAPLINSDTTTFNLPIDDINDLGLNRYKVTLDAPGAIDEVSELNNTATLEVFIYSDNLVPIFPHEFAIVHQQGITLKATTINPFRPASPYKIQIDTTENFNSPGMRETLITSKGGVVRWTPPVTYLDSTVYYWRAAHDTVRPEGLNWSGSSFIYLKNGSEGWNQSHYFQYRKDKFADLRLNEDRTFRFGAFTNSLNILNRIYDNATQEEVKLYLNGGYIQRGSSCFTGTIMVLVADSATGLLWQNCPTCGTCSGVQNFVTGTWVREYDLNIQQQRLRCMQFLDSIPEGNYIVIKNAIYTPLYQPFFVDNMKADSSVAAFGGRSLYHAIHDLGFNLIDSFTFKRTFVFARRKGRIDMPVFQTMTEGSYPQTINVTFPIPGLTPKGQLISRTLGPALRWDTLRWQHLTNDNFPQYDSPAVRVIGITQSGQEAQLYQGKARDTSLSFISASTYPRIRLEWLSFDSMARSSPQLKFWRVLYQPTPEAALNPARHFVWSDSLHVGQEERFETAIENLTPWDMDSMLVRFRVIDEQGIAHPLADKRYRPLPGNDTLHASINFDPGAYPGRNFLYVEANPDNDQPEQYHPNNLGYNPFKIVTDITNPLLDVTFDGVHILNGDLVSAKPFIKVRLKDESAFRALDDSSLLQMSLRYPDDPIDSARKISFDGTIARFIPAEPGNAKRNEASIEFRPDLIQDGRYTLFVSGEDKSGNRSGSGNKFQIEFEVDNKPAITKVLNYPNPFSTSTAFVFTITGYEVPQQFKIQIMTVTGKVVREISRAELGSLHIGRNITDYKWDGKDQYGQLLGNGVYLYRVVTTLNGKAMDAYTGATGDNGRKIESARDGAGAGVDKFFKGGWGKMYIMR